MAIPRAKLDRRLAAWQSSQMDCGADGCGRCRVCRRMEFYEWSKAVASRDIPCTIETSDVDAYIRKTYGNII
jgi:hypothetical protein